ncbi:hypothetical protein [Kribbella sp. NBC_00889]|uniref:hypothetical protein n=1 Tax=Kribbella sp. NBC_00889 TaxID=2975974 RepID=UPI003864E3C8|nr:hypothetical protein OG817_13215 [Kribbella sp. NBC_00889]
MARPAEQGACHWELHEDCDRGTDGVWAFDPQQVAAAAQNNTAHADIGTVYQNSFYELGFRS